MGYRSKRIEQLVEENNKLKEENGKLKEESIFWEIEAKRQAAELGEMKIKIAELIKKNL